MPVIAGKGGTGSAMGEEHVRSLHYHSEGTVVEYHYDNNGNHTQATEFAEWFNRWGGQIEPLPFLQ
jgi:hypothetical protein